MIELPKVLFWEDNTDENGVVISNICSQKCLKYAIPRTAKDSAWYHENRGGYPPKIFDNWYYKAAECASSIFVTKFGLPFIEPDFNIYERGQKSWAADLIYHDVLWQGKHYDTLNFGVKSCNQRIINRGFEESFVFELTDQIFTKGDESYWFCFVHVPHMQQPVIDNADFYIRAIVSYNYLKENLLFQPMKKNFPTKCAVYASQLLTATIKT